MQSPPYQLNNLNADNGLSAWDKTRAKLVQDLKDRPTPDSEELGKCKGAHAKDVEACLYFINTYVKILDADLGVWIPFELWPEQVEVVRAYFEHDKLVILKARQVGLTWLIEAIYLWRMIFWPIAKVLLLSKREEEAKYIIGEERLQGMYGELPAFIRSYAPVRSASTLKLTLRNGSTAKALPTTAGDSYSVGDALLDEIDLTEDQKSILNSVEPTAKRHVLLSKSDKSRPRTEFKNTYRAAVKGENDYYPVFLPWTTRPSRDEAWYAAQVSNAMAASGSIDDVYENYPLTPEEALAPHSLSKRLPFEWIAQCYTEMQPLTLEQLKAYRTDAGHPVDAPYLPGLSIYRLPEAGHQYVIGGDPAEGNPTSDDSALTVGDVWTGEEVAVLAGKVEPSLLASYMQTLSHFYNNGSVLPERNNHGHAVILWLQENAPEVTILEGHGGKPGWLSSTLGKTSMYDTTADAFRDQATTLHSADTYLQLSLLEGGSLRAPKGEMNMDDLADSYALMLVGRLLVGGYIQPQAGEADPSGSDIPEYGAVESYTDNMAVAVGVTGLPGRYT